MSRLTVVPLLSEWAWLAVTDGKTKWNVRATASFEFCAGLRAEVYSRIRQNARIASKPVRVVRKRIARSGLFQEGMLPSVTAREPAMISTTTRLRAGIVLRWGPFG